MKSHKIAEDKSRKKNLFFLTCGDFNEMSSEENYHGKKDEARKSVFSEKAEECQLLDASFIFIFSLLMRSTIPPKEENKR